MYQIAREKKHRIRQRSMLNNLWNKRKKGLNRKALCHKQKTASSEKIAYQSEHAKKYTLCQSWDLGTGIIYAVNCNLENHIQYLAKVCQLNKLLNEGNKHTQRHNSEYEGALLYQEKGDDL